ncbi:MAG: D-tyrosyl-tRNA(Tyr) deacylase [Dehalococcoidia bacterium]|nr:D-tyrosyl-tRNA(Tyr) deacylase [Dehalococcoidia bacterium]
MRALIQRVSQASVTVDGEVLGQIGPGLVVFVGISETDGQSEIEFIVSKTVNLRIFADDQGRFNHSALDVDAQLLVVSQFTLYGDTRRGRRPSFSRAAAPEEAAGLFEDSLLAFGETGLKVETGRFQAYMNVIIHNDGPVTIMIDSDDLNRPRRA